MDDTKLKRLKEELEKAIKKRDDWDAKVKDLERRYKEAENTCIHDMVHAANLTPEQLAELICRANVGIGELFFNSAGGSAKAASGEPNTAIEMDEKEDFGE